MAFGLVPEVLNPIDEIMVVGKEFQMINTIMFEVRHIEHIIPAPAVRIKDTVGDHFTFDYWD
jgi:hypothetical protein